MKLGEEEEHMNRSGIDSRRKRRSCWRAGLEEASAGGLSKPRTGRLARGRKAQVQSRRTAADAGDRIAEDVKRKRHSQAGRVGRKGGRGRR
jgi:hypothetical protein